MKTTSIRKLNKQRKYTADQLTRWKKFKHKYINVYPYHYDYWVDGKGYVTVYELRGISDEIRENYQIVSEILRR